MAESAKLLQPSFSVADTTYPRLTLADGDLTIEFADWLDHDICVQFPNTIGLRWQEFDSEGPEDRNDSVYEILNSSWLVKSLAALFPSRQEESKLRHFRLCFNECGVLDVLAESMNVKNSD